MLSTRRVEQSTGKYVIIMYSMFVVCGLRRDYIRLETFSLGFFSWPGIAVRGVRSGKRHKQTLKTSAITVQHTVSRKEGKDHFLSSFSLYEFS
jgi:hypothetical protein